MFRKIISWIICLLLTSFLGVLTYWTTTGILKSKVKIKSPIKGIPNKIQNELSAKEDPSKKTEVKTSKTSEIPNKIPQSRVLAEKNLDKVLLKPTIEQEKEEKEEKEINPISQRLLNQALQGFNPENLREAVYLKYSKKENGKINDYQIDDFAVNPDVFQKIILKEIAKKINFADLIITFEYYQEFKKIKVKLTLKKQPEIFATIFYQLNEKK